MLLITAPCLADAIMPCRPAGKALVSGVRRRVDCTRGYRLRSSIPHANFEPQEDSSSDLNWLHTRLHVAIDCEDFEAAAQLRDRIRHSAGVSSDEASWSELGVPEWLADRLERLNFPLPTRVQLHALRATERGDDAAICAPTGSGKTLGAGMSIRLFES